MLRHIGFGNSKVTDNLADSQFVIPERLDDLKTLGVREDLAHFSMQLEKGRIRSGARHEVQYAVLPSFYSWKL